MSLFDYYQFEGAKCPECGHPLIEWQGKDGPNALLVWRECEQYPTDQIAECEIKLNENELKQFSLPDKFEIYSYDCPRHQPVIATGHSLGGVWSATIIEGGNAL